MPGTELRGRGTRNKYSGRGQYGSDEKDKKSRRTTRLRSEKSKLSFEERRGRIKSGKLELEEIFPSSGQKPGFVGGFYTRKTRTSPDSLAPPKVKSGILTPW